MSKNKNYDNPTIERKNGEFKFPRPLTFAGTVPAASFAVITPAALNPSEPKKSFNFSEGSFVIILTVAILTITLLYGFGLKNPLRD